MSFKKFLLTEAAFNVHKFDRVLELFERVLEKRIGKIYRYGGKSGFINLRYSGGIGLGFLYFYKQQSAFRINYVKDGSSFRFESVDIWERFGLRNFNKPVKADYRVHIPHDVNIIQIVNALSQVLNRPSEGVKVFLAEAKHAEIYEMLIEAKQKITPEQFIAIASKKYNISAMKFDDIKNVSEENDVAIPGAVWGMKAGKGLWDLSKTGTVTGEVNTGMGGDKVQATSATDLLLISRGEDGKFYKMEAATAPPNVLQAAQQQINRVIQSTNPNLKEVTPVHILFEDMEDLVTIVATGQRPSLMIVGGPGIGKTHTVLETIKKCGLKERTDYTIAKGKVTPAALYRTLFLNRDKLILFDDTDSIWRDGDAVNILKAALDSYDVRKVTWFSAQTVNLSAFSKEDAKDFVDNAWNTLVSDPEANIKLPAEFDFTGRVIFISNLPKEKLDSAVISRSLTIDMTLTQEQVFDRMETILKYLGDPDMPMDEKYEVFNYFKEKTLQGGASEFGEVNMRSMIAGLGIRASGNPNWQRLLRYI